MSFNNTQVLQPLIYPTETVKEIRSAYNDHDIYSAFVSRLFESIFYNTFKEEERSEVETFNDFIDVYRDRILGQRKNDIAEQSKALEYAIFQAVNYEVLGVWDKISLAYYRVVLNDPSLSNLTEVRKKLGVGTVGCQALLFGAEKQIRYEQNRAIIVRLIGDLPPNAEIFSSSRGRNAYLERHLETLQTVFDTGRSRNLENIIQSAVDNGIVPASMLGLKKADLLIGDPHINLWVCTDVKTKAKSMRMQDEVYLYISGDGKPEINMAGWRSYKFGLTDGGFSKMFDEAYEYVRQLLNIPITNQMVINTNLLAIGRLIDVMRYEPFYTVLEKLLDPLRNYVQLNLYDMSPQTEEIVIAEGYDEERIVRPVGVSPI